MRKCVFCRKEKAVNQNDPFWCPDCYNIFSSKQVKLKRISYFNTLTFINCAIKWHITGSPEEVRAIDTELKRRIGK